MTGIENARHDLSDAAFSLETAIDVLSGIEHDEGADELAEVIRSLRELKGGLKATCERLRHVGELETH